LKLKNKNEKAHKGKLVLDFLSNTWCSAVFFHTIYQTPKLLAQTYGIYDIMELPMTWQHVYRL